MRLLPTTKAVGFDFFILMKKLNLGPEENDGPATDNILTTSDDVSDGQQYGTWRRSIAGSSRQATEGTRGTVRQAGNKFRCQGEMRNEVGSARSAI